MKVQITVIVINKIDGKNVQFMEITTKLLIYSYHRLGKSGELILGQGRLGNSIRNQETFEIVKESEEKLC